MGRFGVAGLIPFLVALTPLGAPRHPALAQTSTVKVPVIIPSANTAQDAASQLGLRQSLIVNANACGREEDYAQDRSDMANTQKSDHDRYGNEGEGLTDILLAKVAWINSNLPSAVCNGIRIRAVPTNSAGAPVEPLAQFAVEYAQTRAQELTACATETGETPDPTTYTVTVNVTLTPDCMRKQINDAVMAMKKYERLGTSDLPCLESLQIVSVVPLGIGVPGEWDVNDRELVRLLYLSAPTDRRPGVLDQSTIDFMFKNLLAARGGLGPAAYSIIAGCHDPAGDQLGSPEDTADQHNTGNTLLHDLGSIFDELISLFIVDVGFEIIGSGDLIDGGALLLGLGDGDLTQDVSPGGDVAIPETENHRLNIETSRYLTNAAILKKLLDENYGHTDDLQKDQSDIRDWLLHELQTITMGDFQEYNSRIYTRYSLNSIVNLYDIAPIVGDAELQTAAQIVLDLSEAKFAATSNRGRRIVPFRRRSSNEDDNSKALGVTGSENADALYAQTTSLYNVGGGADHEIARAIVLSGQTQLLQGSAQNQFLPQGFAPNDLNDLVNASVSAYSLPMPILAAAVERGASTQSIRHAGVEKVFQSPAFTITEGGIKTPQALNAYLSGDILSNLGPNLTPLIQIYDDDAGIANRTAIIPTIAGNFIGDIFRFDGVGVRDKRTDNLCVAANFACGIAPQWPIKFGTCLLAPDATTFFVNSKTCFPDNPGPHFFMAFLAWPCLGTFCDAGQRWGVVEVVDAANAMPSDDPVFANFVADRTAALTAVAPDADGNATYITFDGRRIDFTLKQDKPEVTAINGASPPAWATAGDLLNSDGQGRATITGKGGTITIDFTDYQHPKRSLQ